MTDVQPFPPDGIDDVFQGQQPYRPADGPARPSTGKLPDVGTAAAYPRHGEFDTGTRSSDGPRSAEEGGDRPPPPRQRPPPWGFYGLVGALALGAILAGALLGNSLNDVAGAQALARRGPAADEDGSTVGANEDTTTAARYMQVATNATATTKRSRATTIKAADAEPTGTVKASADEEESEEQEETTTTTRKSKKKKKKAKPAARRAATPTIRRRKTTVEGDGKD
ncbi:uncharacterized protein LOC142765690 [Rhipicephalus microplus]|uniref:uncharacterized protein LOC142765690 n=1 Tax=Rhipicephalus microplus TaxID=6941 RepID=UPI003F6D3B70